MEKPRTQAQNRALHKFCNEVANECTAHGVTVQVFLDNAEVDVTPDIVKSLWRKFGLIMFGKKSTADLTTKEFVKVGEEMARHLAMRGVDITFPSEEQTEDYLKSFEIYEKDTLNTR